MASAVVRFKVAVLLLLIHCLLLLPLFVGVWSMFCIVVFSVLSSFAIILMKQREQAPKLQNSSSFSNSKQSAMIGCLWTRVRKQPIIALYFEFETVLKFTTSRPGCFVLIVFLVSCDCKCSVALSYDTMDWSTV